MFFFCFFFFLILISFFSLSKEIDVEIAIPTSVGVNEYTVQYLKTATAKTTGSTTNGNNANDCGDEDDAIKQKEYYAT